MSLVLRRCPPPLLLVTWVPAQVSAHEHGALVRLVTWVVVSALVVTWGLLAALTATLGLALEELRMGVLVSSLDSDQALSPDQLDLVLALAVMVSQV